MTIVSWGGKFLLLGKQSLRESGQKLKTGTQKGRNLEAEELMQKPWRGAAYGHVPHGLLSRLTEP